ncbi:MULTISPECIES: head maturation protease, ClpP-related [Rhodobacterales]|uniref:ATP-dependent Clp protease proteolytic subunit n=1 Tax=Pseudotabrizicola algicola TaxID=2709381 RepID=A0A6B3RMH6_9RHOB|nr:MULTISPECIES: head maturation protease, ClpP-related [Rhodobacterales]NEX45465.1 Clp protease ClpP [Pseudotabrizicola algicola]
MKSWYTIRARGTGAEVLIYDEIGAYGVSAKGFLAELGALPDGVPIDLRLNSPGGSVFDAVAIYNALQRHDGTITVWIDGVAASAASYVAMAGDEIVMPENAFLMIHDPSGLVMGTAADMREMADTMDKIAGGMVRGYAARSGRTEEEIAALMAAETWFDAGAALEAGLATRMIEPVRIAASFDIARFRNAPPALAEAIADPASESDQDGNETAEDVIGDEIGDDAPAIPCEPKPEPGIPPTPDPVATGIDPTAIRRDAIAHARAVIDLCRLAGQPQMAGRFLEQDASLDAVRCSLLAARAEAEAQISPHHPQPGPTPTARPWGDVIARTFKLKG